VKVRLAAAAIGLVALASSCRIDPAAERAIPAERPFASGSRLRVTFLQVDGLRIRWRFFDTTLGRDCTFSPGGQEDLSGEERCLPVATTASATLFADESCTAPLVESEDGCPRDADAGPAPAPDYIVVRDKRRTVHTAGPGTSTGHERRGGVCSPLLSLRRPAFRVGPEIPISSFVASTEQVVETGGRLGVLARRADDGTLFRTGTWDTRRREPVTTDGLGPWTPERVVFRQDGFFHDELCTQEVAAAASFRLPTAVSDTSRSIDKLHNLGDRITGPLYGLDTSGACLPKGLTMEGSVYKVGTSIPPETLEPARIIEVGSGRIRALYRAGADGVPTQPVETYGGTSVAGYRDTLRDEPCSFVELQDGSIRCLPAGEADVQPRSTIPDVSEASEVVLWVPPGQTVPRTVTYRPPDSRCGVKLSAVVYVVGRKVASSSGDHYLLEQTVPLDRYVSATLARE
jgi:hypothetical protein